MTDFLAWLGPGALVATLGAVIKFSGDYAKLKTLTDGQQKEIDRLEKMIESHQAANKEQHEVFYQNQRDTLELKVTINYVKTTLDRLVQMVEALERRRENDR
jgi:hypothetical protein